MTAAGYREVVAKYRRVLGHGRKEQAVRPTVADLAAIGIQVVQEQPEGGEQR